MRNTLIVLLILFSASISAQVSYAYVERDSTLYLDVYQPATTPNGYTVLHMFGGGYYTGSRRHPWDSTYCRQLTEQGYTVVAIDYRLGMKDLKTSGFAGLEALENAMFMAAEDGAAAIAFLDQHNKELSIDMSKIILEGSSAGAITALLIDYGRCNELSYTSALPKDWKPAAVVAYSGAIYTKQGKLRWAQQPAPTLLFHGTVDGIVPYKSIVFGKRGMYGADALVKCMDKNGYPYAVYRFKDLGHEVCMAGPKTVEELNLFVRHYVAGQRCLWQDITIRDKDFPPTEKSRKTAKQLYKENQY